MNCYQNGRAVKNDYRKWCIYICGQHKVETNTKNMLVEVVRWLLQVLVNSVKCPLVVVQQFGLNKTTTWHILRKNLSLKAYKVPIKPELNPLDYSKRYVFINMIREQSAYLFSKSSSFSNWWIIE